MLCLSSHHEEEVCIYPVVRRQSSLSEPLHPSASLTILPRWRFIILLVLLLVILLLGGQEPFHFYVASSYLPVGKHDYKTRA